MRVFTTILTALALGIAPAQLAQHHPTTFPYHPALDAAVHAHPRPPGHLLTAPVSFDGINAAITDELARRTATWNAAVAATRAANAQHARTTTTPRVSTPASPPPSTSTRCAYDAQIRAAFGSAGDWAVAIAWRESNCTTGAKSPTGCWGLFQLCVPLHLDLLRSVCPAQTAQLGNAVALDPSCNIAAAAKLYAGAGTAPWHL